MNIQQIDVTGYRIIGAISELGYVGPKHHGIILGENQDDGQVYIAENMHTGFQIATYNDFHSRYSSNGDVTIEANNGKFNDLEVAQRAITEIVKGSKGVYNLITNNCESFANRAMHNKSTSKQVFNTALGVIAIVGVVWVIKNVKK